MPDTDPREPDLHTCHDDCPCTEGRPLPDFTPGELRPTLNPHGYLQWVRGMLTDHEPHEEIEPVVAQAVDRVKDMEDRVKALETAIDDYSLWEPGRAGHAAAHRKLMEARRG